MEKGICFIVGAGECNGLQFKKNKNDYVIAADGGYDYLKKAGIEADVVIGDFDSTKKPAHKNVIKHKVEKNETDMDLAVEHGINKGYDQFVIFGALGGRLAHSIANIQMLCRYTKQGKTLTIAGDDIMITALHNDILSFAPAMKGNISVFAHGGVAKGVSIKGLKYKAQDIDLTSDFSLGVSNHFIGETASVEVKDGTLIIMWDVQK